MNEKVKPNKLQQMFPYHENSSNDIGVRDWNERMYDKRDAFKQGAILFSKFIKDNYSIVKGGGYRHRGDFCKNSKPKTEEEVYEIFLRS